MQAATQQDALPSRFSRRTPDGKLVWRSEYIGPAPSPRTDRLMLDEDPAYVDPLPGEVRAPQAFLVEQEPGAVVPPHFHYVDQFQVVVAGEGHLGRHPVAPLSVHFAGANTGYGPIQPGAAGLSYFTFRASADETGAQYLPGARPRQRPGPRRNVVVPRIEMVSAAELARLPRSDALCALEEADGLGVWLLRVAPGQGLRTPDAAQGQGASLLVANGELVRGGRRYAAWSCLYASPGDGVLELQAGAAGAEVLYLRYPRAQAQA